MSSTIHAGADSSPVLLFDLGGILVDIDFSRVLDSWAPHSSLPPDELKRRFGFDEAYERHEREALDAAGYFADAGLRREDLGRLFR